MKKAKKDFSKVPAQIKVDSRDQRYLIYPEGKIQRLDQNGSPLPRIRMSKKRRIKLRHEYQRIKEMQSQDIADKILEAPVVNPLIVNSPDDKAEESN